MMVVIGIIAILGAVIVPGFKKIYSDFKIRETYDLLDMLFSAQRSYYLIYNEMHGVGNGPWGSVTEEMLPLLSPPLMKFVLKYSGDTRFGHRWRKFNLYKGLYLFYRGKEIYTGFTLGEAFFINTNLYDEDFVNRVYYLDDLLERYQKKGCKAFKNSYGYYYWYLPEYSNVQWFR